MSEKRIEGNNQNSTNSQQSLKSRLFSKQNRVALVSIAYGVISLPLLIGAATTPNMALEAMYNFAAITLVYCAFLIGNAIRNYRQLRAQRKNLI